MASIWISRPDLEDLIGAEAALKLLTAYPGRSVYVARKIDKFTHIVGPVAAEILQAEFVGCEPMLPSAAAKPPTLKARIIKLLEQGWTYGEIVTELQCTSRHVEGVASDSGLSPSKRAQKASTGTDGEA